MNKRYLGAVLLSPLIIVLFAGGIYLKYVVMFLSLMGMYEFFKIVQSKDLKPISGVCYLLCIVYYVFFIGKDPTNYKSIFSILMIAMIIMLCIPIISEKYSFIDVAITILGFLYVAVLLSFIVQVNKKHFGNYLVWLIFISSWLCDTSAYYVGKYFGKNKLCPRVSPKKTIEGSIGGLLGSTISCGLYGTFIISRGVSIPLYNFYLIGIMCGIFGQFGDLVASSIKRYTGVKDFGNIIPGHGGILDRFDSILFASAVVYYYIIIILGM
ncbi:phosphatidate cytidylyltransferase [Clostridium sp. MB40-C1]|uniref:phosphatidate cytidylyltransferase n=1 Tax=Clostridium sp. MB40-C1 TaxID=3070996 RepID=UPI0027E1F058|nr:phosphatidate cytidylyltransferase [Clostridium sp. MB40-C1]WMJ82428.1 phosphatidate cytidylyltransferase [Clostridium sp. MB40-C1]